MIRSTLPHPDFSFQHLEGSRLGLLLLARLPRAVPRGPGQFESLRQILQRARAAGAFHGTPQNARRGFREAEPSTVRTRE